MFSTCSSLSTRRLATTAQSILNRNAVSSTLTSNITPQCMSMRPLHYNVPNRFVNSFALVDATSTLRPLFNTGSISTRSSGSVSVSVSKATLSSPWSTPSQSRTSFASRKYTSSSSPTSSSSTSTTVSSSSAARILAEESSHVTATTASASASASASAAKTPLTFHEEMTKVRFSFNWWKEWTIIMGVFAVTGSSTVMVVKPVLKEGKWK
ncbi:hypothetical protein BGX20_006636 [Mortierella sp. AD010]|nr:hypothetical protein BGX20_006636 [Mortierella sp. AD010]